MVYSTEQKLWRLYYIGSKNEQQTVDLDLGLANSKLDLNNAIGVAVSTDESGTDFKRL